MLHKQLRWLLYTQAISNSTPPVCKERHYLLFFCQLLAFSLFVTNNLGHSTKTLDGFSVGSSGVTTNNTNHRHNESLLGCFFGKTSLPALHLQFVPPHQREAMSSANKPYISSIGQAGKQREKHRGRVLFQMSTVVVHTDNLNMTSCHKTELRGLKDLPRCFFHCEVMLKI